MKRKRRKRVPDNRPWWILSRPWMVVLICLAVTNAWLCLHPHRIDSLWYGLSWIFDVRLWPLWYFGVVMVVLLLSLHWFRFYMMYLQTQSPKQWPVLLTGSVAVVLSILVFCHRLSSFPLL